MTLDNAITAAAIVAMLAFSAFFAGSETALTAVSKARMHYLSAEGSRRASRVEHLIGDRERLIGVLLFGNTFANILASSLATSLALELFNQGGVAVATAVMTLVILIFSEVLPKTLAIARTDRVALAVAVPTRMFVAVLAPAVDAVQFVIWRVLGLFGVREEEATPAVSAQEEIRGAIMIHHQEGTVEREHRNMLGGILDLAELRVADVMVHRRNMDVLDGSASPEEIVEKVLASGHTRFPVWRDDPENIVGVLHIRDLLRTLIERGGSLTDLDLATLISMPWFVPETTSLEEQLEAFRDRHEHFALVVDEYGVLQGIVTLEDILEEIFGKIGEEHDQHAPEGIRRQADGSYNIDGWIAVRDINRELDWELPDEKATTLAGLVINEARTIPEVGQVFTFFGFKFEILRRQRNQITAIRVIPPSPEPEDDTG